ncbi:uncharacterized protein LOC110187467 [Drosophila serrata]|uniref:uncharacterized protein LOC110187467 n=1 Tax=Drosophila serrata TaxID=7274 RepID=UPI000A1D092A|nr:uncharacterized protein LOC110187467 [Drosophila serrata]
MSCLTGVLQLLQVLTTLSGCNIYRYSEAKREFRVNRRTHLLVRALHRFWLRPWLMVTLVMHFIYWVMEFLKGLTDTTPGSERPLNLIYGIGLTIVIHQNIVISLGVAYYYRYHRPQIRQLLNGFVRIYHGYERICGREPIINWWFFFIQIFRVFSASVSPMIKSSFRFVGFGSKVEIFVRDSGVLFICLQPFLLSVVGHLAILILYACYNIQVQSGKRRRSLQLLDYYRHLITLRQNLDFLVRPIVWTLMLENILLFIGGFHLSLYDMQSVGHMGKSMLVSSIFPLTLLHVNANIRFMEREFGKLKADGKEQPQLQMFWLYQKVMQGTHDKSELNVFNLDREFILESLRLAWVYAMFTNSILLNSTARFKHFESVQFKKLL